jgi:hypothetical protein
MPDRRLEKNVSTTRLPTRRRDVNWWGSVCSIIALGYTGFDFLGKLSVPSPIHPDLAGLARVQTILFIGLAVAAIHGLLWRFADKLFGWHFGAGGGTSLPQGWAAALLSATMTIPLVIMPAAYGKLANATIVPAHHWLAGGCLVVFSAIGHVLVYGSQELKLVGWRNHVFPLHSTDWRRAVAMELVYALMHFSSIVLVYRIVTGWPLLSIAIFPVFLSGAVWFFSVCIFIFVNYPDSVTDKKGRELRGVIHALMLTITLTGGMVM